MGYYNFLDSYFKDHRLSAKKEAVFDNNAENLTMDYLLKELGHRKEDMIVE